MMDVALRFFAAWREHNRMSVTVYYLNEDGIFKYASDCQQKDQIGVVTLGACRIRIDSIASGEYNDALEIEGLDHKGFGSE